MISKTITLREDPINIKHISRGAVIAALYTALTVAFAPISYSNIQFRVSEALTVLPILMPESIPALYIGAMIANIFGGFGMQDIIFGSLATLMAAFGTYTLRRYTFLALLCPVIVNALGVSAYLAPMLKLPYWLVAGQIAAGEAAVVFLLGWPLLIALRRRPEIFGGSR